MNNPAISCYWRIAALLGLLLLSVILVLADTDDMRLFVLSKLAGVALIYAYGKLFAMWEDSLFGKR